MLKVACAQTPSPTEDIGERRRICARTLGTKCRRIRTGVGYGCRRAVCAGWVHTWTQGWVQDGLLGYRLGKALSFLHCALGSHTTTRHTQRLIEWTVVVTERSPLFTFHPSPSPLFSTPFFFSSSRHRHASPTSPLSACCQTSRPSPSPPSRRCPHRRR